MIHGFRKEVQQEEAAWDGRGRQLHVRFCKGLRFGTGLGFLCSLLVESLRRGKQAVSWGFCTSSVCLRLLGSSLSLQCPVLPTMDVDAEASKKTR